LVKLWLAIVVSSFALASQASAEPARPLVPRALLFAEPERTSVQLSPDGSQVAYVAPSGGVQNLWVAAPGDPSKARPLTRLTAGTIEGLRWSSSGRHIAFLHDGTGEEEYRLHSVDLATGIDQTLTPEGSRAEFMHGCSAAGDRLLVQLYARDPRYGDLYLYDLKSGASTLAFRNTDHGHMFADCTLKPRVGDRERPGGGYDWVRLDRSDRPQLFSVGHDDARFTEPLTMLADGRSLLMLDSRGRDTAALAMLDLTTSQHRILGGNDQADVTDVLVSADGRQPLAFRTEYLKPKWHGLTPEVRLRLDRISGHLGGEAFEVDGQSDGDRVWLIREVRSHKPARYYSYDAVADTMSLLFSAQPVLEELELAPVHPLVIQASDGLSLPSYLTLPPGSDLDGNGRPERPVPLVLFPHGGPWWRDYYEYQRYRQFLADRGYAVLNVNFRGSTGFGKRHLNAGDLEWAGRVHQDLIDSVDWAIENGVAIRDKVAIMGGSHGGYATLVGLAFTPDRFACGVDFFGPSSLETAMEALPKTLTAIRADMVRRMGDADTEEGRNLLRAHSPLTRAASIRKPLLVEQGGRDPRVKQAESDQIVAAVKANGTPVAYLLYPDEGHGFARPANRASFFTAAEVFLARCLGGRAEPPGADSQGSSVQVLEGAELVPGVAAAARR
jgi:dipeptidyl aminopeptidase/acylaminoacyl peptidase